MSVLKWCNLHIALCISVYVIVVLCMLLLCIGQKWIDFLISYSTVSCCPLQFTGICACLGIFKLYLIHIQLCICMLYIYLFKPHETEVDWFCLLLPFVNESDVSYVFIVQNHVCCMLCPLGSWFVNEFYSICTINTCRTFTKKSISGMCSTFQHIEHFPHLAIHVHII